MNSFIDFVYNDGGRSKYFKSKEVGDCVTRAIAIATGRDYKEVYDFLAESNAKQRVTVRQKRSKRAMRKANKVTAELGISTKRKWFKDYMKSLGFTWTPTMSIGSGCKVHLRKRELPNGRIICSLSKHIVAVINGVIYDTYDCSRDGTRCVYGYWKLNEEQPVKQEASLDYMRNAFYKMGL